MSISFSQGKKRFEIKREVVDGSLIFVGYVNGERSVTGPKSHIAARVLIEKHVAGAPEAVVLPFPREWHRDYEDELLHEAEPDLAG